MSYNTTQLNPDSAFERHVYHRDQFAHFLRWTHILKVAKIGQKVLDFGCGSGNMLEVFYRNRFKCKRYVGMDIRKSSIKKNNEKFENVDWAEFLEVDLCGKIPMDVRKEKWDIIASFEVIEHIGKHNGMKFLKNIRKCAKNHTQIYISTPCYDEKVGAADNHIIDGEVGEFEYDELAELIEKAGFEIVQNWGTFASMKDYKPHMNKWQTEMFNKLKEYYDTNLISVMMAPFFPEHSRNVLWQIQKTSIS